MEAEPGMSKVVAAVAFLALNFYVYHYMARHSVVPPRDNFASFPLTIDDWRCDHNEPLDPAIKENLGATDTLICQFVRADRTLGIGVYVGYHATQIREEGGGAGENSIHPPAHCLPGSGWDIIDSHNVSLSFPGLTNPRSRAKRLIIAKGTQRQLVYYWYQMQGRFVSDDWRKILYLGYDRAVSGRTDGALVRFTMPIRENGAGDESSLIALATRVALLLPRYVPN
jgi:EpsI family protein